MLPATVTAQVIPVIPVTQVIPCHCHGTGERRQRTEKHRLYRRPQRDVIIGTPRDAGRARDVTEHVV